ncbi:hypothetical protein BGW36DRAFT_333941 [Talaromyces proteolyticus]|uniref:Heterokaryon incompatibility domain-containing protein n=1 Tax=Talaromyces proteolyticus TaxID=1131652 RepID=A0AAD4L0I2_9EURO|nr:uncharacterized protein BGW36DRAFT_333941 [Talaromyces proteolyticus]KAH8703260.1 hypothetical protein BGW36DRAFT_333941 [Talaromyces proteolyticus]
MDHLPLPEGAKHFIVAPYEAPEKEWYDGLGFLDFPERRGWSEKQLLDANNAGVDAQGLLKRSDPLKIEQFFQTWLFFGLVIDVLAIGGITVTTEDFLKPKGLQKARIVDTTKLPALLTQWRKTIEEAEKPLVFKIFTTWDKLNEKFERAKAILNHFCVTGDDISISCQNNHWPVRDEISTTMIALAFSLRKVAITACNERVDQARAWPGARSKILTKRLEYKWCLADVNTALKELSVDGHYYVASSPSPGVDYLDHHHNCLPQRCLNLVDEDLYLTCHAGPPWHKQHCKTEIEYGGHLGDDMTSKNWVDAVCRVIDKGALPVALWKKDDRQLWSSEYHLSQQQNIPYIAISHVWADGMGNPDDNWLPECQLDRITHYIENIRWKSKEPTSDEKSPELVCFWMDTLCIPVQAENKARRKQAIASMRHIYTNARGVLVLDSWLQQIPSTSPMLTIITRLYQSNWLKRLWTHQEGFLPSAVYIQFSDQAIELDDLSNMFHEYNELLISRGLHLGFPQKMYQKLLQEYTLFKRLFESTGRSEENRWTTYLALAASMSYRQTSRLADETICLATLLSIDLDELLAIPDKPDAEAAKQRMIIFLRAMKKFETTLIFNNYERLNVLGFQWAPKSLLNFRTADAGRGEGLGTGILQEMNGELGLLVRFSGFVINFSELGTSLRLLNRPFTIKCRGSLYTDGKWFVIHLPYNGFHWPVSDEYAIILSTIPKVGETFQAIVGPHHTEVVDDVHVFEHQSLVTVEVRDDLPPEFDELEISFLNRATQWLIR